MGRERRVTRRQVLAGVGGLGLGLAVARITDAALPASASSGANPDRVDSRAAFLKLKEGNERFVRGVRSPGDLVAARGALTAGQHPFATIVGCSDSRVPPEIVFDQGLGQLFVVRVAGNVVDTAAIGTVQYAVHHLHTPLVVVLGHEKCGAVSAALGTAEERAREPRQVRQLLDRIRPSISSAVARRKQEEQVHVVVEANVLRNVKLLEAVGDLRKARAEGAVRLAAAVYDLQSGRVRWLL
jgi:carbonic anhydrase